MSPSNDPLDAVLRPPPDESPEEAALRETREEQARCVSAAIDAEIKAERLARRKKRIVRLLLLGQSESGKSTTLRRASSAAFCQNPLDDPFTQNFNACIRRPPFAKNASSGGR